MKLKTLIFIALTLFLIDPSNAQTKDEATAAYNKGVQLATTDMPKAVASMKEAADIAEKVGSEADDILQMASQQIPLLQYNYAISLYKEKKMDEAIENFKLAHQYAGKYKDESIRAKSADLLPKLYLVKGNGEMKDEKFTEALISFNEAIGYDSTLAKAYLLKGLVFKKQDKFDEMKASMDKAIETGNATNDEKTVASASKSVADEYLNNANVAFKKGNYSEVASQVDESIKYAGDNPEAFYVNAVAYNKLSNWDDAIANAEKGLSFEESTPDKQARFYFEIGTAQIGKADNEAACASFKKAAIGPYAESANYQIKTVLKCN